MAGVGARAERQADRFDGGRSRCGPDPPKLAAPFIPRSLVAPRRFIAGLYRSRCVLDDAGRAAARCDRIRMCVPKGGPNLRSTSRRLTVAASLLAVVVVLGAACSSSKSTTDATGSTAAGSDFDY